MRPERNPGLMAPEQIPVVDLRCLSHSDLRTIITTSNDTAHDSYSSSSLASSFSALPKIDKSVFNESAGSRKQTYSRLRLAPVVSSAKRSVNNNSFIGSFGNDVLKGRENQLIVSHLRKLFAEEGDSLFSLPDAVAPVLESDVGGGSGELVLYKKEEVVVPVPPIPAAAEKVDRDKEVLNSNDEEIDLGKLASKVDPYILEIQKRTEGMKSDAELLGFLGGLEGEWMSRRQRRRFVDASGFGNHLPKGWKLLLGLKRKEGSAWVNCRRFVSPNGHHFETCKEVSCYIQSLLGIVIPNNSTLISTKTETSSFGANNTPSLLPVRNTETENNSSQEECKKCHLSFTDKKLYLQHQLSFHQKSRKRRRRNTDQNDEIIMKDGKYICQYCEKSFDERSRYFGHMGAHVRYQGVGIGNPRNGIGNPKIGEVSGNGNPRNGSGLGVENSKKAVVDDSMSDKSLLSNGNPRIGEMSKVGNPRIEIAPLVENPKNGGITPLVENPNNGEKPLDGNPRIENTLMVGNPKNIEKPLVESPRNEKTPSIENPKTDKAPSIENPKNVENPKTRDTNSNEVPLSSENPKIEKINTTEVPLSSENPKTTETGVSFSTPNPQNPKSPEPQIPSFIQNPKTETQLSPLFELQSLSSIQTPINQTIPFQNPNPNPNNNNISEFKEPEEFYEMNEDEYPPISYPQMVSQIFSPDELYDENEISNNNSEEMNKCNEMETFDLNNFDIVSNSNNSNNATNICKASSEETSFMDEGNEINESPITFSQLLANANAHANANLDLNTINNPNPNPNNNNLNTSISTNNNHQHLMQNSIPEFHWTPPLLNPNSLLPLNPNKPNNNYSLNPNSINELIPKPNNNNYSCFPPSVNNFDMNMEWVKPGQSLNPNNNNNNNNNNQASGMGRNFMEMMTMQDTGLDESFTSMVQSATGTSSSSLHMNNNLNNNNNLGGEYQHHQYNTSQIPNFSNNNMLFNFGAQMVNPSLQLGWGIRMPAHQQSNSVCVSVCVWCAREFRHEAGSMSQQNQADSLGFICPNCKDRFSAGHLGL